MMYRAMFLAGLSCSTNTYGPNKIRAIIERLCVEQLWSIHWALSQLSDDGNMVEFSQTPTS